ncbi:MAG: phenylalanine--tRNA ligase subunit beta [Deltaproteobacteria bacterium]|jgi:phenylalanyl-tRNA synthetase beta chain|nr:phenylalanine--tRNA ligase subunit beta [Deltaproteobacteria bacterium]
MRVALEWIKEFVPIRQKAEKLADIMTMSGLEVEEMECVGDDIIFELGVTANRADCLSVKGVARDISALTNVSMKIKKSSTPKGKGKMDGFVKISVKHKSRCPRYAARVIDGIKIGPSPSWIVRRLADCGIRSINNVVDATNYVMLETGQPLHAFDTKFLKGDRVVVRKAADDGEFTTLDSVTRKLISEDLLICDNVGPVAMAGIMGGENSEVRDSTTRILLESAYFEPGGVRRTSKRLGLSSESSRRFERGVDPNGVVDALHRLTEVILSTAGGTPTADWVDIYPKKVNEKIITISAEETNRILGTNLKLEEISGIMKRLGFKVAKSQSRKLSVTVPTVRVDIVREIDLIEEVARIHGYGKIAETMPFVRVSSITKPRFSDQEDAVRESLVGSGLSEIALYGFTSEKNLEPFAEVGGTPIIVTNPLSSDQAVMRTMLIPGLLDVYQLNANRQSPDCRLFSIQSVFNRPRPIGPLIESKCVAGVMAGKKNPERWERASEEVDFYDIKGVVENIILSLNLRDEVIYQRGEAFRFLHPGRFAHVLCQGKRVGFIGQLHPDITAQWDIDNDVHVFELSFDDLAEVSMGELPRFTELSKFPYVDRDIALLLPDKVPAVEIERVIQDSREELVTDVKIFDVYKGKGVSSGQKSLAITIRFARNDRTLTDDEVNRAQQNLVDMLKTRLGAALRT